jgi:MFS family permease
MRKRVGTYELSGYHGTVRRLLVVQALVMFILWVPIWVVFLQRKGLSLTQIGVLEAIAWILTAALEVPTGVIADRWGRKASIATGTVLYALAMFLILTPALSPTFLLGYALWNGSIAFVSGADSALLYDSLKADGREAEAAKFTGRFTAIQLGSQGIAALAGSALATVDITLCFSISGILAFAATILVLTVREPPRHGDEGEKPLTYWNNLRAAVGIAARRPLVRAILLMSATFSVVPLVVYYFLLQPYALAVGLPIAALGVVVVLIQGTTVTASWLAHRAGRRFELKRIVTLSAIFLIGATVALGVAPSIPSVGLMLVVALVPALVGPLLMARMNDLIPSGQRATILSLGALIAELGTAGLVPLLLGLADALTAPLAIGLSAVLFGVVVFPLLILWRASEPRPT